LLDGIMLQGDEGLEKLAVLLCKLVTVRVLLDFALSVQALATSALKGEDPVA